MSNGTGSDQRAVLSVSDITRQIRFSLEEGFSGLWIEGEISGFKFHTSGHMYFTLKDDGAQIQSVMFRRENAVLKFEPSDGMKVLCFGRVSVYPPRGQYQLYVERIEPKGVGALQIQFEALKEKLKQEGLFDPAHKKEIPYLPKRIGIITSANGAALHDILHVLDRRFRTPVLIYPVAVQGAGSAEQIAEAIGDMNLEKAADVLIVARGGGSLEDLWAFNEEVVARAIFASEIPVISAVGHEVDFTIADFVSDLRAATPSVAAELVMPVKEELIETVESLKARLSRSLLSQVKILRQRLDEHSRYFERFLKNFLGPHKEKLLSIIEKLEILGPLSILKRGFSVTMKMPNEKIISSVKLLSPGDLVKTKLNQGSFISQIKEVCA